MGQYNYTVTAVNCDLLTTQIKGASLPLSYMTVDGGTALSIFTTADLTSDQQTSLAALVAAHVPVTPAMQVTAALNSAKLFGTNLAMQFAIGNVLAGITQAGMTQVIADACQNLNYYLTTGSLYAAIAEINTLSASSSLSSWSPFITTAILTSYRNQIQTYLGITLT